MASPQQQGSGLDDGSGFCRNQKKKGRGGGQSCDPPPRSHWKGQCYNYTHQRKSGDSRAEAWSAHLQQQ